MIAKSVRDLVGNTPLYEITSFDLPAGTRILAKLEWMNPGGSVKDRLGIQLVDAAIEQGYVTPGGTIIEPTAGNTGIGLALAAKKYDLTGHLCRSGKVQPGETDVDAGTRRDCRQHTD